jgi:hypothetical protein
LQHEINLASILHNKIAMVMKTQIFWGITPSKMAQNLIMEAESSFETSLTIYQSTRSDIPD